MKKRNDENLLIKLEKNFRCTPGIVDIADTVIRNNDNRLPKKMVSGVLEKEGIIQADRYGDREKQFAAIAERIKKLHEQGVPYKEIAILVRKGKTIVSFLNSGVIYKC